MDDIVETFHREGPGAAWMKFMGLAGYDTSGGDAPAAAPEESMEEPTEEILATSARVFGHELKDTTRYLPDVAALTAGATRVVIGVGVESGHLLTYQASIVLAKLLGASPVEFPGEHVGFVDQPKEFAEVLRAVLTG